MTVDGHALHDLVDELPDDQVAIVLADVRRHLPLTKGERTWPPRFFGIGESNDGRTDNARRADEIIAEGFGARRS